MNKPFTLTNRQRESVGPRYNAGESTVEIARDLGVTKAAIRQLLITRGIPRRANNAALHRTYSCNHQYFAEPLDEERAYWIGFILADGCIAPREKGFPVLAITLKQSDRSHLVKLRRALQSNHRIISFTQGEGGYGEGTSGVRLHIASGPLTNALGQYGVVPQKTNGHGTPNLPARLQRHMYRGYVDGDGSLGIYQIREWPNPSFECVGPRGFLEVFGAWLSCNAGANLNSPLDSPNTKTMKRLRYGGTRQVADIVSALYGNASVFLDRKYETAQEIIALADSTGAWRRDDGRTIIPAEE